MFFVEVVGKKTDYYRLFDCVKSVCVVAGQIFIKDYDTCYRYSADDYQYTQFDELASMEG